MEKVHHPVQNTQPILLSLACDNNKFIVSRDGSILSHALSFKMTASISQATRRRAARAMSVTFGSGAWLSRNAHPMARGCQRRS